MDLGPRQASPQRQHERIICPVLAHFGISGINMKAVRAFFLQAHMRQRRAHADHGLGHGIMQIRALPARDLDHRQLCPGVQMDAVPRMKGDGPVAIGGDVDQHDRTGVDALGHMQLHAVFGQHGVQRHQRLRQARQGAEIRMIGKPGHGHMLRHVRQIGAIPAIDQHQTRPIRQRTQRRRVRDLGERFLKIVLGQGTKAGVAPRLGLHARQCERRRRLIPQRAVSGQPRTKGLIARDERVGARLQHLVHAAAATTSV